MIQRVCRVGAPISGNDYHLWVLRGVTGLLTGPLNSLSFCMNYHRYWDPRRDVTPWCMVH